MRPLREAALLAHLMLINHCLGMFGKSLWFDLVGFIREVLLTGTVPVNHHEEHDETPGEGDDNPDQLDLGNWLSPPNPLTRWCDSHG